MVNACAVRMSTFKILHRKNLRGDVSSLRTIQTPCRQKCTALLKKRAIFPILKKERDRAPISRVLWSGCLTALPTACHLSTPAVTRRLQRSTLHRVVSDLDGPPSDGGIHELAAPSEHSVPIARRLVVSYTAFSPLPARCRRLFSSALAYCRQ